MTLGGTGTATIAGLALTGRFTLKGNRTAAFSGANTVAQAAFGDATQGAGFVATLTGNLTVTNGTPASFANQSVTRVYPLFVVNETGGAVAGRTVRVVTDATNGSTSVWNGTTVGSGYAAPNVTFTAADDATTRYLYVDGFTEGQTAPLTLLNDTPLNWSLDTTPPVITLNATTGNITSGAFSFNVSFPNDTRVVSFTIANGSATWTNGSDDASQLAAAGYEMNRSFSGLYLPAGDWTLNVTATDRYNNTASNATVITSVPAILATLTGAASKSATIGGSDVTFTFNVTVKSAGSVVKAFLNLTSGALVYDATHAALANGSTTVDVSGSPTYTGAGNVTLAPTTYWPAHVLLNLTATGEVRQGAVNLSLTPYSGLVAGTYAGTYGFGVFG